MMNLAILAARVKEGYPVEVRRIEDAEFRGDLLKSLEGVRHGIEGFTAAESKIKADTLLSTEGKRAAIQKLIEEAEAKTLKALPSLPASADINAPDVLAITDPKPANEVLEYLRLQEVRGRLAGEDHSALQRRYMAGIQNGGDSLLVRALESDPMPRNFVTEASREVSRMARLKKVAPLKAERIEAAVEAKRLLQNVAGNIKAAFQNARAAA